MSTAKTKYKWVEELTPIYSIPLSVAKMFDLQWAEKVHSRGECVEEDHVGEYSFQVARGSDPARLPSVTAGGEVPKHPERTIAEW
jgi:hypothetical protein